MAEKMTLEDIKSMDKLFLTAAEIAPLLGCDPHYIRVAARTKPDLLGFPVAVYGSRTKIPRLPFINFIEGGNNGC